MLALRTITRPSRSRILASSSALTSPLHPCRNFAQATDPPTSGQQQQQLGQQTWKRRPALATAQTLTLFSESPQGLLIALRSTLEGMTTLASRIGPLRTPDSPNRPSSSDHVLLYSLSKDLPSDVLSEAIALLRADKEPSSDAVKMARVGILSSSIPASLIPAQDETASVSSSHLYSASLSLLPGINAVPFRSEIPGRAPIAVGRWPDRKPSWQSGSEQRADLLDDGNAAIPGGSRDWRDIWGRENIEGKVPDELQALDSTAAATFLVFSDPSPQGLIEGIASRFAASSVLGLYAPSTPFETGRDHTLLLSLPGHSDKIYADGAVGVALVANVDAEGNAANKQIAIPSVTTSFEGLRPFGPRHAITGAQGNVISTLDGGNAAQQFLRATQSLAADTTPLSEDDTRTLASRVRKDAEFYAAIYSDASGGEPLLLAQILSGAPSRGTISLDTDAELGTGPSREQAATSPGTYVQFLERETASEPSAIEIPGPDPTAWATPRFMFLALSPQSERQFSLEKSGKHQVMALPNLFLAASERGWLAGKGNSATKSDKPNQNVLNTDGSSIVSCTVPLARAVLSLRGD